jgi:chromosome segregation ATPase
VDIQDCTHKINTLENQLAGVKKELENARENIMAMDLARKQHNFTHMKECIARQSAQTERKSVQGKLEEEKRYVDKIVTQFEDEYQSLKIQMMRLENDKVYLHSYLDKFDADEERLKDENDKYEDELFAVLEKYGGQSWEKETFESLIGLINSRW